MTVIHDYVEQDMYPAGVDVPEPTAQRTYHCLCGLRIGQPGGTGGEQR